MPGQGNLPLPLLRSTHPFAFCLHPRCLTPALHPATQVIRGRVLAGAFPASLDDAETDRILSTLLELGVNTFVCLQARCTWTIGPVHARGLPCSMYKRNVVGSHVCH